MPEHDVIVPNQIYATKSDPLLNRKQQKLEANRVLMMMRVKGPTKQETIDCIVRETGDFLKNGWDGNPETGAVKAYLNAVPREIIAAGIENEGFIGLIRKHFNSNLEEGRTYLDVNLGTVPIQYLSELKCYAAILGGHEEIINGIVQNGVNQWSLLIRFEKSELPSAYDLKTLLTAGVRDSDVLKVVGQYKEYKEAANLAMTLHSALQPASVLDSLRDDSENALKTIAASTFGRTIERIMEHQVANSLASMIEKIGAMAHGSEEPMLSPGSKYVN